MNTFIIREQNGIPHKIRADSFENACEKLGLPPCECRGEVLRPDAVRLDDAFEDCTPNLKGVSATLEYKGTKVDMSDRRGTEKLIQEMIKPMTTQLMGTQLDLENIQKLKTTTELKEIKDADGQPDFVVVTRVQFEVEGVASLGSIHNLMAAGHKVDVTIGSAQKSF